APPRGRQARGAPPSVPGPGRGRSRPRPRRPAHRGTPLRDAAAVTATMAGQLEVTIDGVAVPAAPGRSLFECAEDVGVTVPTSCFKQGKCRECLVEVEAGSEHLSPPAPQEEHLSGRFRLACRTRLVSAEGAVRCHTLRRGTLRIETDVVGLGDAGLELDPAVTRDGARVLLDG